MHSLSLKKTDKTVLAAFLLLLLSLLSRAHLFLPFPPAFGTFGYDDRWWWTYQSLFANGLQDATEFYRLRTEGRFPLDSIWQQGVVALSSSLGLSRLTLNLIISSLAYFVALYGVYALAKQVLQHTGWALLCAFLASQSYYFFWLRYGVFSSKLIGFALFPWVLWLLLRTESKERQAFFLFSLFASLNVFLYPGTPLYTYPALLLGGLYLHSESRTSLQSYLGAATIIVGSLLVMKFLSPHRPPPPLHITEFEFRTHVFYPHTWGEYARKYGLWIALGFASSVAAVKFGSKALQQKAGTLLIVALGCFAFGLLSHVFARDVAFFRMAWTWRAAYYAYLPACLLGVLFCQLIANRSKVFSFLCVSLLGFWILSSTPAHSSHLQGVVERVKVYFSGSQVDLFADRLNGVVEFATSTPEDSVFLMPPWHLQDEYTALFEGLSGRVCAYSRLDQALLLLEYQATAALWQNIVNSHQLEQIQDPAQYRDNLRAFATSLGADFALFPSNYRAQVGLPVAYSDKYWRIYKIK